MLENLHDFNLNIQCVPDGGVTLTLSYDVVNGSSIWANGVSLADSLDRLAILVRATKLKDSVWQDSLIIGVRECDAYLGGDRL